MREKACKARHALGTDIRIGRYPVKRQAVPGGKMKEGQLRREKLQSGPHGLQTMRIACNMDHPTLLRFFAHDCRVKAFGGTAH